MPKQLSIHDAEQMISSNSDVIIYDIRDQASFDVGHIPGAQMLSVDMIPSISFETKANPVLVCCYHGVSSQAAANFLASQGFAEVYSIMGGYTAWSEQFNVEKT